MPLLIAVLVSILVFLLAMAAYDTLARRQRPGDANRLDLGTRVAEAAGHDAFQPESPTEASAGDKDAVDPAFQKMLEGIARLTQRFAGLPLLSNILFTPANLRRIDRRLAWAGRPFGFEAEQWVSVNIFLVAVAFVYGVFGLTQGWMPVWQMVVFLALSLAAPSYWLSGRIKARHMELERELPNIINKLILASTGSSQSMMYTLNVVVEYTRGELTNELGKTLREARLNREKDARTLFTEMAERCGNQNVTSFCNTIINAINVQANVTSLLREQQEAMKEIRKANNEAIINKTETYLMVSASLGILCVLIMVAAPSFVSIMQGISSVGGS